MILWKILKYLHCAQKKQKIYSGNLKDSYEISNLVPQQASQVSSEIRRNGNWQRPPLATFWLTRLLLCMRSARNQCQRRSMLLQLNSHVALFLNGLAIHQEFPKIMLLFYLFFMRWDFAIGDCLTFMTFMRESFNMNRDFSRTDLITFWSQWILWTSALFPKFLFIPGVNVVTVLERWTQMPLSFAIK